MEWFYCSNLTADSKEAALEESESRHLRKVLRKQQGEIICLTDGNGRTARARVGSWKDNIVHCDIISSELHSPQPARDITVALSPIRPNRMDWAVEKLCELGVGNIQPVISRYTVHRHLKSQHLERVSISALKQSQQAYRTGILPAISFAELTEAVSGNASTSAYLCAKDAAPGRFADQVTGDTGSYFVLAIGPEGGYTDEETALARAAGFKSVHLGTAVLRTESAAVLGAGLLIDMLRGR